MTTGRSGGPDEAVRQLVRGDGPGAGYRPCAGRGMWTGLLGLGLATPVAAQDGPDLPADPIAASNRMTDPFHRPAVIQLTASDAPWLSSGPGQPTPLPIGPPPAQPQVSPPQPV